MNQALAIDLLRALAPILVFVMVGYCLRRMEVVGERGTDGLSRWVLLCFFPVLVFHRLGTTDPSGLIGKDLLVLVWAPVVLVGSGIMGWWFHALFRMGSDRKNFAFLVAMPNWIYLPLAIAGPVWGDEAVCLVILFNVPCQLLLWSAGVQFLHGSLKGMHALRYIITGPGLLATVAGLLVAFGLIPVALRPDQSGLSLVPMIPLLHVVGGLTIPLSLVALGLYLGERSEPGTGVMSDVLWVCLVRLLIAPAVIIVLVMGLAVVGSGGNSLLRWVVYLIVTMPVAVTCPLFADMFDRDRVFASRAVVVSSMIGLFSSPLIVWLALEVERRLGLMP